MTDKASDADRAALEAAGWAKVDGRDAVQKTYVFANFIEAFGFMSRAALWAEKLNHHPEWSNVYRTVDVVLTTHDIDGLSALDVKLAQRMDELAGT